MTGSTTSPQPDWGDRAAVVRTGGAPYGALIDEVRRFLDLLADAGPDEQTATQLTESLRRTNEDLAGARIGSPEERVFGRRSDLPNNGTTLVPLMEFSVNEVGRVEGRLTFGPYFLGGGGAVHGGAIPLVLDHIAGAAANAPGQPASRTARLTTNYRSVTLVGHEIRFEAFEERSEGRKRFWQVRLWDGETLCVEAELLMVVLRGSSSAG